MNLGRDSESLDNSTVTLFKILLSMRKIILFEKDVSVITKYLMLKVPTRKKLNIEKKY